MILAFIIFWVAVGAAVVLIALRGGAQQPSPGESKAYNRLTLIGVVLLFAFGIAVPAIVMADNAANKAGQAPGGVTLSQFQQHGRYLFGQACAVCHTLKASEANGHVGPNLDVLRPAEALVLDAILHGRARGNGNMPALLFNGRDAQAVAGYVHAVAGH
jgi:mono/diheme cytochrome c family protein